LVRDTTPLDQAKVAKNRNWRGASEIELRGAIERWGRARWPEARVCHELVMNRGSTRLDIAFVAPAYLAVVELKSGADTMERAIHQVGLARLSAHEVWLICDRRYGQDMRLIRHMLPTVGIAEASGPFDQPPELTMLAEAVRAEPYPEAIASLLWVSELAAALRIGGARPGTHASLAKRLAALPPAERDALVCRALRGRDALWRADPPVRH